MTSPFPTVLEPATDHLLLIVVGAHLRAEARHRPLGYRLRDAVLGWLDGQDAADIPVRLQPLVLTDLWYLNHDDLHGQPVIAIGEPEVNAASAYLGARLPAAFVIEDALRVQLDPEFIDLRACMWGAPASPGSHAPCSTAAAVDAFMERYLDEFLRAAHESI
ncbi:MAG TPA: hypothetical protein PK400_05940 [Phycisphaerales bacterium]|nr:hypothetical protein [Phycisphaerales bacterium]HRQ76731.1 hypothetical protein [Phycisphaerales bacterium]